MAGEYYQKADTAAGVAKAHTIVMYDNAFESSDVAFVEGGTAASYATRMIVHEIGHAVDLAPLAKADKDLEAATTAVTKASGTFTNAEEKKAYDDAVKAETAAKKAHQDARSRSGTRIRRGAAEEGGEEGPEQADGVRGLHRDGARAIEPSLRMTGLRGGKKLSAFAPPQ